MPGPGKQAVFVNPFKPENRNIGRRTGRDVRAGKNIRIFHDGIENFDDYWSDSDASTLDSDDKWLKEKENEKRIKGKAFAKNPDLSKVVKPAFQIDSSLKSISPFSPDVNSGVRKTLESTKRRDKTSDHGTLTKSRTSVAVAITPQQRYGRSTSGIDQAGDVSGSITKDKSSGPVPNSPLQSFQTRKRLTYSGEQLEGLNEQKELRDKKDNRGEEEEEEEDAGEEDLDATLVDLSSRSLVDGDRGNDHQSRAQLLSLNNKKTAKSRSQQTPCVSSKRTDSHVQEKSTRSSNQKHGKSSTKPSKNKTIQSKQVSPVLDTEELLLNGVQENLPEHCTDNYQDELLEEQDISQNGDKDRAEEVCRNVERRTGDVVQGKGSVIKQKSKVKKGSLKNDSQQQEKLDADEFKNSDKSDQVATKRAQCSESENELQTGSQNTNLQQKIHPKHTSLHTLFPHNDSGEGVTDRFSTLNLISKRKSIVDENESDEDEYEIIDEIPSRYVTDLSTTMNSSLETTEPKKRSKGKKREKKHQKEKSSKNTAGRNKSSSKSKKLSSPMEDKSEDEEPLKARGGNDSFAGQPQSGHGEKKVDNRRSFENLFNVSPVENKKLTPNSEDTGSGPGRKRKITKDSDGKKGHRNTGNNNSNRNNTADEHGEVNQGEIGEYVEDKNDERTAASDGVTPNISSVVQNKRRTIAHMTPNVSTIEEENSHVGEAPEPASALKSGKVIRAKRRMSRSKLDKKGKGEASKEMKGKGRPRKSVHSGTEETADEFSDYFSECLDGTINGKSRSTSVSSKPNGDVEEGSDEEEAPPPSPPSLKKGRKNVKETSTKKTAEKKRNKPGIVKGKRKSDPIPPAEDNDSPHESEEYADDVLPSPPTVKKKRKSVTVSTAPALPTPSGSGTVLKSILKKTPRGTPYSAESSPVVAEKSLLHSFELSDSVGVSRTPRFSTAPPQHFFEVTASETPQIPEKPTKTVKLIVPEPAPDGLRRSSRTRIPPLQWYKNERPKYSRRKSGGFIVTGILPPPVDEKPKSKKKLKKAKGRRKGAGAPHTPRNMSMHVDVSSDTELAYEDDLVAVVNPETQEEVYVDCIKSRDNLVFLGPSAQLAEPTDDLILCKSVQQKAFSVGELILRPLREKPMQFVKNDTMVFRINVGKLAVTIHKTCTILESGDVFFVPKGNCYSIKNLRDEEAKLVFFQHKG